MDSVVYVVTAGGSSLIDWATFISAVAAFLSTLTAIVVMIYTIRQFKENNRQNRLMVKPYLSTWIDISDSDHHYCFTIQNNGAGPAIITSVSLSVNEKEVNGQTADLIEKAANLVIPEPHGSIIEMFSVGDYIPPGKSYKIIELTCSSMSGTEINERFAARAHLLINYSSITGEQYVMDSKVN